jgi:hypothetical protein
MYPAAEFPVGGIVPSLIDSLRGILEIEGARTAALVDAATGMVLRSAGEEGVELPAAAACLADEARLAAAALGPAEPGGELREVAVVTASRFQVLRVLESRPGEGTLLFVDLDRSRTNMALATLQVGQSAPGLLA